MTKTNPVRRGRTGWISGVTAIFSATSLLLAPSALSQTPRPIAVTPPPGAPVSFADLIDRVSPAVVSVSVVTQAPPTRQQRQFNPFRGLPGFDDEKGADEDSDSEGGPEQDEEGRALGSGFFISSTGYIATNNHVVENAREVVVTLKNGDELEAEIIGTDEQTDLAVLKVKKSGVYPFVEFATKAKPRVGDWVVAVGNPFGLGGTATAGIVSADGRELNGERGSGNYNDFIQIDAPINRGNSGGPTFNLYGQVIGVNTAIFSDTGGGSVGIGFAIEAEAAKKITDTLIKDGKVVRGWLGVQIQNLDSRFVDAWGLKSDKGAVVASLTTGGPAETAGIRENDIIIAVNGQDVKNYRELTQKVGALLAGSRNSFKLIRDGQERTIWVTVKARDPELGKPSPAAASARASVEPPKSAPGDEKVLGATVRTLGAADMARYSFSSSTPGLLVVTVDRSSPISEAGISPGDALLTVNNKPLKTPKELQDAITAARSEGKGNVILSVGCGNAQLCGDGTVLRPVEIKP